MILFQRIYVGMSVLLLMDDVNLRDDYKLLKSYNVNDVRRVGTYYLPTFYFSFFSRRCCCIISMFSPVRILESVARVGRAIRIETVELV